jgi:hypothetical protein
MATNLSAPKSQTTLASSGVLVTVKMTTTTLSVSNKAVSDEICAQKRADNDAGNFIQKLIGKNEYHQAVMSYRATIDAWMNGLGYEWGGRWYIVPTINYPRLQAEFNAHKLEFTKRVNEFLGEYQNVLGNIAFKQGDMFDRTKYPTVDELRDKFSLTLSTMPVPDNDWRVKVSADIAQDLHDHYQHQHNETLIEIGRKQSDKLREFITRLIKACTVDVDQDGKVKRGRLYDSTIEQALELCDHIAQFNPIQDAKLDQIRVELSNLLRNVSVPALKESDSLRTSTKQNLDSILSAFGR